MYLIELLGRIFLSSLFLVEGINKLFFFQEETKMYMEEYGIPEILFFPSSFLEIVFPILIIVGFKTRFCASIMALFTITVAIIFHTDFDIEMQLIIFLKDISIAGGFLVVAANENRYLSIDNLLKLKNK